jgi:hypothetical protein
MQTCRNVKSKEVRRSNLKLQKTVQEAFGKHKNTIALCVIKKCLFCSPYRGFSCSPYRILCRKFSVFTLPRCSPYRVFTLSRHYCSFTNFKNVYIFNLLGVLAVVVSKNEERYITFDLFINSYSSSRRH